MALGNSAKNEGLRLAEAPMDQTRIQIKILQEPQRPSKPANTIVRGWKQRPEGPGNTSICHLVFLL